MAPRELPNFDPDEPNPIPRTVKIAGWLFVAGGLLNLFSGALLLVKRQELIDSVLAQVADCKSQLGAIGAAITSTDTSDFVTTCKSLIEPTPEVVSGWNTSLTIISVVGLVIGFGLTWSGWNIVKGARWARKLVTVVGGLLLALTMLGFLGNLYNLASALFSVVGLALVYIGKGATYYIRAKAKGIK